jgi:hypothetical protein
MIYHTRLPSIYYGRTHDPSFSVIGRQYVFVQLEVNVCEDKRYKSRC